MIPNIKKNIVKILKITGISITGLLIVVFSLPYLFPQTVSNKIKQWTKGSINGQMQFSKTGLSFFKHFPSLTLTLYDLSLKGSAPFETDTLVTAKEVSLGINLSSVFSKKITIDKIFLDHAFINIQTDTAGRVNYNVYKAQKPAPAATADTASASLGIDLILVQDSRLIYNDRSLPMKFIARGFNYRGSGDLSKDIFDLHTHTEMASVDFYYDNQAYLVQKKVNADLITQMNTKSLAFVFQKNNLLINQLPVQFTGKFGFLKNGYDMDFKFDSRETNLHDIVTALPPAYLKWLQKTDVRGTGDIQLQLAGKYIAADSLMPDLSLKIKVRSGYINNKKSPVPISNLYVDFNTSLPGLDPDSLQVNLDSLYFKMGKDYFASVLRIKGAKKPDIYAKVNTQIDLEKWSNAFGAVPFTIKGKLAMQLQAKGKYATGIKHSGVRKVDTVITSIPQFSVKSTFSDGYFKYFSVPEPVKNIRFKMEAVCPDHNFEHTTLAVDGINANVLDNYLKGYFKMALTHGYPVDAGLMAKFNLADVKRFYPVDGLILSGNLEGNLQTKGKYLPAKRIFPVTTGQISLQNGSVQTKYYPHSIQNIQVNTQITNTNGALSGLAVHIKPVSFVFEDQPFALKADLKNFDNLEYKITSNGTLDIGKIYQVFAVKDYNVNGIIKTNLSLKGKQSDAIAGNYAKLDNSGTLRVRDIALTSDLFPKPFLIEDGSFSFNQDKMQFDAFKATYGNSIIVINGALSNVIDYATKPNAVLKGDFKFSSNSITANDFMAFAGTSPTQSGKPANGPSGVIMVPGNLDLNFEAAIKKITYNGLELKDAKGQMSVSNGSIVLKQTGFNIIGTPVTMDAT